MKVVASAFLFVVVCCGSCNGVEGTGLRKPAVYRGTSDASAAVALGEDMFVVADDENNILRVYKTGGAATPIYSYDVSDFLGIERDHPEADIEGAAKIGRRVYWIASHGRNKDGKIRPNRHRFFATDVDVEADGVVINPVGKPCRTLVRAMLRVRKLRALGLDDAAGPSMSQVKQLAPKKEGLNIEGLCASADGRTLYIGFRNPRPIDKTTRRARALVVPLKNPAQVIEDGAAPVFGEPILWDLGGLGIRSMEYSPFHKAYFVVAGSFDKSPEFALYRWSGKAAQRPELVKQLGLSDFGTEALVVFEKSEKLLLLSDDGTLPVKVANPAECMEDELNADGTCPNKYLIDPNKKSFRAIWLKP